MNEFLDLPQLTFILGGARSGKSTLAEKLASGSGPAVLYCATAEISDEEMRQRVDLHRSRRPDTWVTLEAPTETAKKLEKILSEKNFDAVLIDCLSIFTSNALLKMEEHISEADAWERFYTTEFEPLLTQIKSHPETHWFVVSNEVGMGVVPAYELGRQYRDLLGRANQKTAAAAGTFYFMAAGVPLKMKPRHEYL